MKTIGLIGGMSWESSAEYYRIINQLVRRQLGGQSNARSLLLSVNFQEIVTLQTEARWHELGAEMQNCARLLEQAGADFLVLCTNTMHRLAHEIEAAVSIPLLHIVDPTALAITREGHHRVGLLGTRFAMEGDFYRDRLKSKHGLDVLIPAEAVRAEVHRIIYDELCRGEIRESSRTEMARIIDDLASAGAHAVILGCTELSLLVKTGDSSVPLFDTTFLHAQAAVSWALAP